MKFDFNAVVSSEVKKIMIIIKNPDFNLKNWIKLFFFKKKTIFSDPGMLCCLLQVTDMMVANSSNLIITVKPVNQRNNPAAPFSAAAAATAPYKGSTQSMAQSRFSLLSQGDDEPDEVVCCHSLNTYTSLVNTHDRCVMSRSFLCCSKTMPLWCVKWLFSLSNIVKSIQKRHFCEKLMFLTISLWLLFWVDRGSINQLDLRIDA